jgi:hypothetical protein
MLRLLAIFSLLFSLGSFSLVYSQTLSGLAVVLNKTKVQQWCPISKDPNVACPFGGEKVNIHVEMGSEADISLRYRVSGGRIVGSGKDVVWDLTDLVPGHYQVTVKTKQGGRSLSAVTKTIVLEPCPDCDVGCTCQTVYVVPSKASVNAGDVMEFVANVSGSKVSYKWTVENGKIVKGSKSSKLTVRASQSGAGQKLSAKLEIGGTDRSCSCPIYFYETVDILPQK